MITQIIILVKSYLLNYNDTKKYTFTLTYTFTIRRSYWRCSIKKMCSEKYRKIHMKTPVPESFNKDAGLRPHAEANVIEKDAGVFL